MKISKILVLNLGTTSFKFKLFDFSYNEQILASGVIEGIGDVFSNYSFTLDNRELSGRCRCNDFVMALEHCIKVIKERGIINSIKGIDAIGYKAVHGGPLMGTQVVSNELLETMEEMVQFAPSHNPMYINMMRLIKERYPDLCQIVRFETSFHHTIPEYRIVYGVPYEWKAKYGVRKYGFHGSSHEYIAGRMKQLDKNASRIVSAHLGGSSSLCAIQDGLSIANSMGATPQSGLFNNNRVGDFDIFCLPKLIKHYGNSLDKVLEILGTKSGFLGLSGVSNDLRKIVKAQEKGNKQAELTIKAFVDNIIGYIGMYTAYLGGLDALVFTGGIGQNSKKIRSLVCEGLGFLRILIDGEREYKDTDCKISLEKSGVSVWVIKTDEEKVVAREVRKFVIDNSIKDNK